MLRRRDVIAGVAVAMAVAGAAMPATVIYTPGSLPLMLGTFAAGGVTVTMGLRSAGRSAVVTICAALALLGVLVVGLGAFLPRSPGLLPLVTAVAVSRSGAQILTSVVPIPVTLESVALPVCLTWLTGVAAAIGLRSGHPVLAALPPVVLFGGAVALVGPTPTAAYGYTALLVASLVVLFGVLSRPQFGRSIGIRITMVAALLVGTTLVLGPSVIDRVDRQAPDPRAHVVPPYRAPDEISPLSRLSGWAIEPDEVLLELRTDQPTRLRWVTYPDFTGVTWEPAATYRAAGALLPVMTTSAPGPTVRGEVSILGLTGGWLPLPDGTREIHGVRVAVDVDSATVVAPDGLRTDLRYTLTASPTGWSTRRLTAARLPTSAEFDRFRLLPAGAPARLNEVAQIAGDGATGPYDQALRLCAYLRENFRFDPAAPGGNGYPSLDRFLIQHAKDGGGRGTSEQFATAFAVLARALGIPARVAVGFNVGELVGEDRYVVRARDAHAWGEVYLDGLGWIAFDPTPSATDSERPENLGGPVNPLPTQTPQESPKAEPTRSAAPNVAAPQEGRPTGGGTTLDLSPVVLVALLILGWGAVPLLRMRRRSARLGRSEPRARVLGAWAELRDGLRLAGQAPAGALAVAEVATLIANNPDERSHERAEFVAGVVNAVGFGGVVPDDSEARRVAEAVRDLVGGQFKRASWPRRLTWWFDPRPLWWRGQ